MVKDDKYYPVLYVVIPALGTVYAAPWAVSAFPCDIVFFFFLFLAVFSFTVSLYTVYRSRNTHIAACILFGFLTGFTVSLFMMHQDQPLRTLVPKKEITALSCEFLADPVPFGAGDYRVPVRSYNVYTENDSMFSATGTAEILFPAGYIQQSFPGFTASGDDRILPAAGLSGRFPVTIEKSERGKCDRFRYVPGETIISDSTVRSRYRFTLIRLLYDWHEPGGLLLALLTANRDYLEPSLSQAFRNAGLSHILALSGMHLAILGGIAFSIGFAIGGKRFAILTSLILMICFVWFAGRSPSLSRALFMAMTAVILRRLGLKAHPLSVIMLACLLQLIFYGRDAFSVAFMLSYSALLGIMLPGTWLIRILEPLIPAPLTSGLCASFGAQLFTVPVVAITFGILSPFGILASCVITPLITLYLAMGLGVILITLFYPGAAELLLPVYDLLYRFIKQLVMIFSALPGIVIQDLYGAVAASILSVIAVFLLYYVYHMSKTRRAPDALFTRL